MLNTKNRRVRSEGAIALRMGAVACDSLVGIVARDHRSVVARFCTYRTRALKMARSPEYLVLSVSSDCVCHESVRFGVRPR